VFASDAASARRFGAITVNTKTTTPAPLAHSINSAAARLGIGRVKLYELINNRELASLTIGAKRLIPESELQRFIAERIAQTYAPRSQDDAEAA
jgi:excisionase family DNA binding protein